MVASFTMMRSGASYAIVDATGVNTICFEAGVPLSRYLRDATEDEREGRFPD